MLCFVCYRLQAKIYIWRSFLQYFLQIVQYSGCWGCWPGVWQYILGLFGFLWVALGQSWLPSLGFEAPFCSCGCALCCLEDALGSLWWCLGLPWGLCWSLTKIEVSFRANVAHVIRLLTEVSLQACRHSPSDPRDFPGTKSWIAKRTPQTRVRGEGDVITNTSLILTQGFHGHSLFLTDLPGQGMDSK